MSYRYAAYQSIWGLLDGLFPPICVSCQKSGQSWCNDCLHASTSIQGLICEFCGGIIEGQETCDNCAQNIFHYHAIRSWGYHLDPIKTAIHHLKYRRNISLGIQLAALLKEVVIQQSWQPDIILPIPLAKQRNKQRGYNQAVLLAYPLALSVNIPFSSKVIKRVVETRSQIGLSYLERKENVRNAFQADPARCAGKNILLVDDVLTTGATMDSAALALKNSGAEQIFGVTVTRAI